jgi:hypothetical protein
VAGPIPGRVYPNNLRDLSRKGAPVRSECPPKGGHEPPALQILVEVAITQAIILGVRRGVGFLGKQHLSQGQPVLSPR